MNYQQKYLKYQKKIEYLEKYIAGGYLQKVTKFTSKHKFNDVFIYQSGNTKKMTFKENSDIIQSQYDVNNIDKIYLSYLYYIIIFPLYVPKIESILLVGLGGGYLAMFIKKYFPNSSIDIVEINDAVLEGAKSMGFDDQKFNLYIEDVRIFIEKNKNKKYDVIIIDLDSTESFNNFNFNIYSQMLTENGMLVINICCSYKEIIHTELTKYFKYIKTFFSGSNFIYLCQNNIDKLNTIKQVTTEDIQRIYPTYKYADELVRKINKSKSRMTIT